MIAAKLLEVLAGQPMQWMRRQRRLAAGDLV